MKSVFRKDALNIRKNLSNIDLTEKIINLKEYKESKTVFIYISYLSEVDTKRILNHALSEKCVLVPYCVDDNGTMIACQINSTDDLISGRFGILEPKNPVEFNGPIDFSVIPGVAFSYTGKRIGYGKGYYDRFLSKHSTFSVGVCHDELLFEKIPCNEFDQTLNMVITEKREVRI